MKNIVVLGGSFSGVGAVHHLLKHVIPQLPDPDSYKVLLVTPSTEAVVRPATVRALISDDLLNQDQLWTNLQTTLEGQYSKTGFRFVHGNATALDADARTVAVQLTDGSTEQIEYHGLIIATGATSSSPLFSMVPDAAGLRETWAEFRKALPGAKHIVLAGGGPTAVETAAELGEHLNGRSGWFSPKLHNPKVPITLVTSASKLLPELRESIAATAEGYLGQLGVTVVKNVEVTGVSPGGSGTTDLGRKAKVKLSDGRELDADIYIPGAGRTPNTSFVPANLLTDDDRINVDASTLRVEAAGPRVYSLGDAAALPKASIYSIKLCLPVLAHNIKRDLLIAAGKDTSAIGEDNLFKDDEREMQLVAIGRSKGVGAVFGMRVPSWFVWMMKGKDVGLSMAGSYWNGKDV